MTMRSGLGRERRSSVLAIAAALASVFLAECSPAKTSSQAPPSGAPASSAAVTQLASSAPSSQPTSCASLNGQTFSFSLKIALEGVDPDSNGAKGEAHYDFDPGDFPCASDSFEIGDPRGQLICQVGQTITGSGIIRKNSVFGDEVSSTTYTCSGQPAKSCASDDGRSRAAC